MYLSTDKLGHHEILDDQDVLGVRHIVHHRKHLASPTVQRTDKYGRVHTVYQWRDGSVNRLPEPMD